MMRAGFVVVASGLLVASLASCTRSSTVVLVNASEYGLAVRYEREWPLTQSPDDRPMLAALDEYDGSGSEWRALVAGTEYQLAEDGRTVTLILPPESALRLAVDVLGADTAGDVPLRLRFLELRTATGLRRYEGSEVGRAFTQVSGFLFELRYP
jgi:hypothetical protein